MPKGNYSSVASKRKAKSRTRNGKPVKQGGTKKGHYVAMGNGKKKRR